MEGVAQLMLDSAHRLAACGADFLICPDNTIHQAMEWVAPHSPLPWLHIAAVTGEEAARLGYRRLGILGTRWLVGSDVYPRELSALAIEAHSPPPDSVHEVDRIIMEELVNSVFDTQSTSRLVEVIKGLADEGCDAVVLGCTELPLVLGDHNSPLPVLDSTRLLAHAALRRATASD